MPINPYPNEEQRWKIAYSSDGAGDLVRTFQVSFTADYGKVCTARRVQPFTVVTDNYDLPAPSSYVLTNADGVLRYWKHWDDLWKTDNADLSGEPFELDTLTSSPDGDDDGDLAVFGRTEDGLYDILYATDAALSQGNIAKFDRDFSTTAWIGNYWTGLKKLIAGSSGTPNGITDDGFGFIKIKTTAAHGYTSGDSVVIRDASRPEANGTWTIAVTSATEFILGSSTWIADGYGGTVNRVYASATGFTYLGQPDLDEDLAIILKRFSSAQQDLLFVGNGNALSSIDQLHTVDFGGPDARTSNVVYRRLVFFADYEVNWIQVTKDRVYAGFRNRNDPYQPSYVVEYDPLTETANPVINYNGQTTGFIYENICHIVDVKGWISRFNSNGFTHVAAFPLAYEDGFRFNSPHRNGVDLIDGRPHILMPASSGTYTQVLPAGVYCWEPDTNRVYHKGSAAQSDSVQNDYGAASIGDANDGAQYGALFALHPPVGTAGKNQDFFAGMRVKPVASGSTGIIGTFSPYLTADATSFNNRGWVVTSKRYSKDINAIYRNIVAQYSPNQYPYGPQAGAILVKYRTVDPQNSVGLVLTITGTWTSTTTFTVPSTFIGPMVVGDEIFIVTGKGAGLSAHVTIKTGSPTATITIDETVTGATGTFDFVYENWRKLTDEVYTDGQIDDITKNNHQFDIPENEESWVQFKIEIRTAGTTPFRGFSLEEFNLGLQENMLQEGGQRDRNH